MIVVVLDVFMRIIGMLVSMFMRVLMAIVMMTDICLVMFGIMRVAMAGFAVVVMLMVVRLGGVRRFGAFGVDDLALHPLAIAAAARVAMPRAAVAISGPSTNGSGMRMNLAPAPIAAPSARMTARRTRVRTAPSPATPKIASKLRRCGNELGT